MIYVFSTKGKDLKQYRSSCKNLFLNALFYPNLIKAPFYPFENQFN